MATNRADTLDPALLRPGRLDRKIEFPLPSRREKRLVFQTVTSKMNLGPDVDLEDCQCFHFAVHAPANRSLDVSRPDRLSSAEIASIVQAAGLQGTPFSFFSLFRFSYSRHRSRTEKPLHNSTHRL
jgi:26S proteasome regulatory subunit T3